MMFRRQWRTPGTGMYSIQSLNLKRLPCDSSKGHAAVGKRPSPVFSTALCPCEHEKVIQAQLEP